MHVTAIIAAGGTGRRLGAAVPKQLLELGGRSILERSVEAFASHPRVTDVIVALPADLAASPPDWLRQQHGIRVVTGGQRRQESVAMAFDAVAPSSDVVLVHDAARPFVSAELIGRCIDAAAAYGGAIAAVPVHDTVKRVAPATGGPVIEATLPRDSIYLAQTPQAFTRDVLRDAVALGRSGVEATDEAALAERAGHPVRVVEGDSGNVKITTQADLERSASRISALRASSADAPQPSAPAARVGTGYDLHRLVEGRSLILGGVTIPFERGALGHSDADVACHALTDAVLGAACLGDIGRHFPDSDPRWRGAPSVDLLRRAAALVRDAGHAIVNADVVIVLERPKIGPHVDAIRAGLASALGLPVERVSVKGKTNEGVDAVGRGDAIAAYAVALLIRN